LRSRQKIDGCSEIGVFLRIALPLSKPIIATFALFYAVGIWNDFFHALLYINDSAKWPLQMVLRQVTILSDLTGTTNDMMETVPPEQSIKLAVIVIATLPILAVYPFLQKHFAKGILIGSVKG
jgi:putative aldouronate transport system permease protein